MDYCGCKSEHLWGWTVRGLNLNDLGGSPSFSSTIVAQLELRMFGIHSSIFPPDFSVLTVSPAFSRVFFHVDSVLDFFPAAIFIPGNLAAWDESAWNVSREGSMHATRWRNRSCRW